jgi:hypothetical protein
MKRKISKRSAVDGDLQRLRDFVRKDLNAAKDALPVLTEDKALKCGCRSTFSEWPRRRRHPHFLA